MRGNPMTLCDMRHIFGSTDTIAFNSTVANGPIYSGSIRFGQFSCTSIYKGEVLEINQFLPIKSLKLMEQDVLLVNM